MTLSFPKAAEVPLEKPPLTEVICQVRFSPILRIGQELPVSLQDELRTRFPDFAIGQDLVSQGAVIPESARLPIYNFTSVDQTKKAILAVNFFALSTSEYESWNSFRDDLEFLSNIVSQEYDLQAAGRVGLRYVNKFSPENTQLQSMQELAKILADDLTRLLETDAWDGVEILRATLGIPDGDARLNIRVLLDPEPHASLDLDYFEAREGIPLEDLISRCDNYHDIVHNAFRWCVKDEALTYFGPSEV